MSISDDEIRLSFYTIILDYITGAKQIDFKNPTIIRQIIEHSLRTIALTHFNGGFKTYKNNYVTSTNVSPTFKYLVQTLELYIRLPADDQKQQILSTLSTVIIQRDLFKTIFEGVIEFYNEITNKITEESIQSTFYQLMVEQLFLHKNIVNKEDIEMQLPFVFLFLPALAMIETALVSKNMDGILLLNHQIVTNTNCPDVYKHFMQMLMVVKNKFKTYNFNEDQIELIRLYVSNNPDLKIDETHKTQSVTEVSALVGAIATEITAEPRFKQLIQRVIEYAVNMLKE